MKTTVVALNDTICKVADTSNGIVSSEKTDVAGVVVSVQYEDGETVSFGTNRTDKKVVLVVVKELS